jgi:hypothetical protein
MRALAYGLAVLLLSSCTTDSLMSLRPEIDVGTSTAAIQPAYIAPPAPLPSATIPSVPVEIAAIPSEPVETFAAPPEPVEIAAMPSAPVLLEEPPAPIRAAAMPSAPARPQAPAPTRGLQTLVPSNPMMVAYPRFDRPAKPSASMPADEVACRKDLKRLGVTFQDLAPIRDSATCGIDHPVKVASIGSVTMKPAATLSCRMAATFARWTRKELVPTARWKYFSGVKTIHQGSSYSCRRIARSRTPSQHSVGNALDIMRIELNNGRDIDVRKPGWFSFRQKSFLNNVRADGCDYFTTVLGPGYNYDHRNHFHFDIMPRKNGYVACK